MVTVTNISDTNNLREEGFRVWIKPRVSEVLRECVLLIQTSPFKDPRFLDPWRNGKDFPTSCKIHGEMKRVSSTPYVDFD